MHWQHVIEGSGSVSGCGWSDELLHMTRYILRAARV
jgi:hypothetical protein